MSVFGSAAAPRGVIFGVATLRPARPESLRFQLRAARTVRHVVPAPSHQHFGRHAAVIAGGAVAALQAKSARRHRTAAMLSASQNEVGGKSLAQTRIEELIALNAIAVILKSTCPISMKAMQTLRDAGANDIAFIDLDKLKPPVAAEIQEIMGDLTGATTVPRVFIGRKFVGGGSETAALAEKGELKPLVDAAKSQLKAEVSGEHSSVSVLKSEDEWANELDAAVYRLLRKRGTERPGSHEYHEFLPEKGHFCCAGCNLPLYSASSKYASSCGWPVFDRCYNSDQVGCHVGTRSDGSGSLEIFCFRCNGHLGHVFFDSVSPTNPNGERH